jgi:Lariat debranching enzyme, C-terminal domain
MQCVILLLLCRVVYDSMMNCTHQLHHVSLLNIIMIVIVVIISDFLQVVSVPPQYECGPGGPTLVYDAEWLAIMRKTHSLLSTSRGNVSVPSSVQPVSPEVRCLQ